MMEALAAPEKRFDYSALAPAAAALCYPFLLKAFHALVGPPAATPSPFAILGAVVVLAVAFVVPFFGLAMALSLRRSGTEAIGLRQRGGADALRLPRCRPGPGSQSHPR